MPGGLHEVHKSSQSNGFLAFIRLVGTAYFKKHIAAFNSIYNFTSPHHLYNTFTSTSSHHNQHQKWLQQIRTIVADRITTEEERVPSYTSLWRHWLRRCWTAQLWQSSMNPDVFSTLPPPQECGWLHNSDGSYTIDWEDIEVQDKIKETIDFLVKGCTCKKGCNSNRCRCRKKENFCGPGCECQGCVNIPIQQQQQVTPGSDSDSEEEDYSTSRTESPDSTDNETFETEVVTMDELLNEQDTIV